MGFMVLTFIWTIQYIMDSIEMDLGMVEDGCTIMALFIMVVLKMTKRMGKVDLLIVSTIVMKGYGRMEKCKDREPLSILITNNTKYGFIY